MGMNTPKFDTNNPDFEAERNENDSWETRIGRALRASVSTRADRLAEARISNYSLSDVMERVRVRARRRQARRAGVAVAACVATIAAVVGYRMLDDEPSRVLVVADTEQDFAAAASASADDDADDAGASDAADAPEVADDAAASDAADDAAAEQSFAPAEGAGTTSDDISAMLTEISSGPPLDWDFVETGLWDVSEVQSLGDGRVLIHGSVNTAELPQVNTRPVTLVTSDGRNWAEVNMPEELSPNRPDRVAVDGDHWVVAGFDPFGGSTGDSTPFGERKDVQRVFTSQDAGTTWTEISIEAAISAEASQSVSQRSSIELLLVRGTDIVIAVNTVEELDIAKLAEESGVVPEGRTVLGWSYTGLDDSSLALILDARDAGTDESNIDSAIDSAIESTGAGIVEGFDSGGSLGAPEAFEVSFSELGLTPEEINALVGGPDHVTQLLYSDGTDAEVTNTFEGGVVGTATNSGFAVYLTDSDLQGSLLTSSDGRNWTETPQDTWSIYAAGFTAEAAWIPVVTAAGTTLIRNVHSSETQTVATLDGVIITSLDAGPAGLGALAVQIDSDAIPAIDRISSATATVVRDGYELRYNDPPGSMTLVDLSASEEVLVIGLEEVGPGSLIEVVRVSADGALTFIDPATSEDLVTFTAADSEAIESQLESFFSEAASEFVSEADEFEEPPTVALIGWSADGTDWVWQTHSDVFGVGDDDSWSQIAVGADFVITVVNHLPIVGSDDRFEGSRVFVAPTN